MTINDGNPNFKEVSNRQLNHLLFPISFFFGISLNVGINGMDGQENHLFLRQFSYNPSLMHSLEVQNPPPGTLFIKSMP
jgi:hypothetical protein